MDVRPNRPWDQARAGSEDRQAVNAKAASVVERRRLIQVVVGCAVGTLRRAILAFLFALLGLVAQWPALVGGRVFDFAVDGAAFVVLG